MSGTAGLSRHSGLPLLARTPTSMSFVTSNLGDRRTLTLRTKVFCSGKMPWQAFSMSLPASDQPRPCKSDDLQLCRYMSCGFSKEGGNI